MVSWDLLPSVDAFGCMDLDGVLVSVGCDDLVGMCRCVDLDGMLVSVVLFALVGLNESISLLTFRCAGLRRFSIGTLETEFSSCRGVSC